jgi:hypothetical protein
MLEVHVDFGFLFGIYDRGIWFLSKGGEPVVYLSFLINS